MTKKCHLSIFRPHTLFAENATLLIFLSYKSPQREKSMLCNRIQSLFKKKTVHVSHSSDTWTVCWRNLLRCFTLLIAFLYIINNPSSLRFTTFFAYLSFTLQYKPTFHIYAFLFGTLLLFSDNQRTIRDNFQLFPSFWREKIEKLLSFLFSRS